MDANEIDNRFTYHAPTPASGPKYERIRQAGKDLAWLLSQLCPPSRELSLAMTKLRESCMWANAAIACNQERAEQMDEKAARAKQQLPDPEANHGE